MVNYRRNRVKGGTYFFTLTLRNRKSSLLIDHIDLLRFCMRNVQTEYPYKLKAAVILPDHLHVIWTLPSGDDNFSLRWRMIKQAFTLGLIKKGIKLEKNRRGEHEIWQRRFWEHTIRDDKDLENHVNYIHYNPAKHGYVKDVVMWPYSSFHLYVKRGLLPKDWGSNGEPLALQAGE